MNTDSQQITVSGITVQIVRKAIKNLHLGVYPPDGRVRVAVPLQVDDEAVRLAVISRLAWVKRQKASFRGQARQSARKYVTGESHYFQGNRYRLNVVEQDGRAHVTIRNKRTIDLFVNHAGDNAQRARVFQAWYRRQLKASIQQLIEQWQPVVGVQIAEWGIKQMKTKWGTCNVSAQRIWLNLELVKKPLPCLEFIIVHEMVHLLERHHNDRFIAYMDKFLPQWWLQRDVLNQEPLGDDRWEY